MWTENIVRLNLLLSDVMYYNLTHRRTGVKVGGSVGRDKGFPVPGRSIPAHGVFLLYFAC